MWPVKKSLGLHNPKIFTFFRGLSTYQWSPVLSQRHIFLLCLHWPLLWGFLQSFDLKAIFGNFDANPWYSQVWLTILRSWKDFHHHYFQSYQKLLAFSTLKTTVLPESFKVQKGNRLHEFIKFWTQFSCFALI